MQSTIYKQGRAEGRTEGREAGLREALLLALSTRHVRLSAARRAQIEAETRAEVLQTWLKRAITATRAADVFAES